jgi:integrase
MALSKKNDEWFIDYRANGRRIREKIGKSKALAKKELAKRSVEIAEGRFLDVKREKNHRFAEAAERFLAYSEANKRLFTRDFTTVNKHLLPVFGEKRLQQISSWDVETYKARRKGEVTPATVNRELACLKTIFNKAIHWGMAQRNPVRGVKLLPESNRRLRFLMADEIALLLKNCPDYLQPIVITALNTGMRRGEILNLTLEDVDFDRRQILVRDSKNGESRTIEMNTAVVETLSRFKEAPRQARVFLGRAGNTIATFHKAFKKACSQAGIADFRFHDLRHSFASNLVMNGTDLTAVKELLGHKSIQMTMRYAHLSQAHKKKAVDTLTSMMDGHFLDTQAKKVVGANFGESSNPLIP